MPVATISNATDPNRTIQTTANVAPQDNTTQAPAASTGNFSTLQKYLGANQGSGQRLAGAIGGNLNNEASGLENATQRGIQDSSNANKNITNLTNQTESFTKDLNSKNNRTAVTPAYSTGPSSTNTDMPIVNPASNVYGGVGTGNGSVVPQVATNPSTTSTPAKKPGPGYDVNSYQTDLNGEDAAKKIAADAAQLKSLRDIATGKTAGELRDEATNAANTANTAANTAYSTNIKNQGKLNNFGDRSQLLQNAINSKNQRAGIQNLDNALLSQDRSGTLNQVNQNLQNQVGALQQYKNTADIQGKDVSGLSNAQSASTVGLNSRMTDMQKEQQDALTARVGDVNAAKDTRTTGMESDYKHFKDTGEVSDSLYNDLGLGGIADVDALARAKAGLPAVDSKTGTPYSPRLFNSADGKNVIDQAVNLDLLRQHAATGKDVANQGDIDYLGTLNALAGGTINDNLSLSKYTGEQLGDQYLKDEANKQGQDFVNHVLDNKSVISQVGGRAGQNQHGGQTVAVASNADMLYKDAIKKYIDASGTAQGTTQTYNAGPGIVDSSGNIVHSPFYGTSIGDRWQAPVTESFDKRSGSNYTSGIDSELAQTSENNAIDSVKSQINQDLQNRGYNNLVKRMKSGV